MTYYLTTIIKSVLFYFGYFPAWVLFAIACKLEGTKGASFWANVRVNPLTIITSIGIWAIILILIATLWIAGSKLALCN